MAVTLTCVPAAPRATIDACRIDVAGADTNDAADNDVEAYPTRAELRQYLAFVLGGEDLGKSYIFTPGVDGEHQFNTYIFPSAGSWTVELRREDDDSVLGTQAVTVS